MSRRCPTCNGATASRAENASFPFCSARCKQIDLSRWLGGDYVISRSLLPSGALAPGAGLRPDDPLDGEAR